MNILFISPENPYPPQGGHHLRSFNVLRLLAREHKIYFVGFAQGHEDFYHIPQIRPFCETVDIFAIPRTGYNPGFLAEVLRNLGQIHPLVAHRYYRKEAQERIRRLLQLYPIDLVHIDMLACSLYRSEIGDIPAFVTNHNVESLRLRRWCEVTGNPLLRSFLWYQYHKLHAFEKKMCARFDRCITVSRADRDYLQKMSGRGDFAVIPNGVDTRYFRPVDGEEQPGHLVWVGGMATPYNADAVDFFIEEIWPHIVRDYPDATIDFIGLSPTRVLRSKAAQDRRIRLTGFVDDIRPLVQQASIFVAPIRSGSGTKIKVLNAMAQGKAVVATSVAAEGIDALDGEHLCIADDPRLFADRVCELLNDQERRERLGKAARALIDERNSWDVIEREMSRLYGSSAQGRTKA
jgi:glycosyltransferase involved in cell wall biosynthesis